MKLKAVICYVIYQLIAKHLPKSDAWISFGSKKIRAFLAKGFIYHVGTNVNIQKGAHFSRNLSIGDNSGIGINSVIQGKVAIGNNVMMGPEVYIYTRNHEHSRVDIPMIEQGFSEEKAVVIGDDVWIGSRVTILPGVTIGKGVIIGAGTVVAKDVPDYSVVVGNPASIVKNRNKKN